MARKQGSGTAIIDYDDTDIIGIDTTREEGGSDGGGEAKTKNKRTSAPVRTTPKEKKLTTQLALLLQLASTGVSLVAKNKHIEFQQTVSKQGSKTPKEALTIARPLALMLLDSPFADTVVQLAETSAVGGALLGAVLAYVTRVIMDTMKESMAELFQGDGGMEMLKAFQDMMGAAA